jgi:hypothetical protein
MRDGQMFAGPVAVADHPIGLGGMLRSVLPVDQCLLVVHDSGRVVRVPLRPSANEVHDQQDDGYDQENVYQAPRQVKYE